MEYGLQEPKLTQETINLIDDGIREMIIELNKLEGVETFCSCSGHGWRSVTYVLFKYNESDNLKRVLAFFKNQGFDVELTKERAIIDNFRMSYQFWWEIKTTLRSKIRDDNFSKDDIWWFWDVMLDRFRKEFM